MSHDDKNGDGLALPLEPVQLAAPNGFLLGWCVVDANKRVLGYCMTERQAHQLADAANSATPSAERATNAAPQEPLSRPGIVGAWPAGAAPTFKDWWRSANFKDDPDGVNKAIARAAWYAAIDSASTRGSGK